jgi:RNA polymerase sigma factor (sigma-70 family)
MESPPENIRIERLCVQAQSGDKAAERELFSVLTDSFRIFTKHRIRDQAEAEDVVQDALTVVIQKYKGMEFVSCFAGWAHNVLRNTLMNHLQTRATRTRLQPQALAAMVPGESQGPDDELLRNVLHCLEQVARSNRRFARALNLHYQGFTAVEIAGRLEVKIDYLYVVLARARSMLVACLGLTKD